MKGMPRMSNTAQQSALYHLLKRPLITEKSVIRAQDMQYTFEVDGDANKIQLAQAFELAFPGRKVKAVRVLKIAARTKRFGKSIARINERRKAIFKVEGEPLEFFTGV